MGLRHRERASEPDPWERDFERSRQALEPHSKLAPGGVFVPWLR